MNRSVKRKNVIVNLVGVILVLPISIDTSRKLPSRR